MRKVLKFSKIHSFILALASLFSFNSYSAESNQEKKIALVVGNANYEKSPLINPTKDSADIASKLKGYGFEVVYRENLHVKQIGAMLREFKSKLTPGATALVFYAGHGLQLRGENYLPTVDADIQSEEDIQNQSVSLRQIMDLLEESKTRTNLVFLDACRNNPFERKTRSLSRGLATINAPSGTLIAYSTRPGSVAEDGKGRNGLYTEQLLKLIDNKKPIEQVLKQLVSSVKSVSKGRQEPWSEGSLEGDFCFGGCLDENAEKNRLLADVALWESIIGSTNISDYQKYLNLYPNGTFASLARKTMDSLKSPKPVNANNNQESINAALLKQAEATKRQEIERLSREKIEREKLLALTEEKIKLDAINKQKLEAELAKSRQEAESLRKAQGTQESNSNQLPKKIFVPPTF